MCPCTFSEDYEGGNALRSFAENAGCRFISITQRGRKFLRLPNKHMIIMNKFTILFLTLFLALPMAMKADSAKRKKDDTRYLVGSCS